MTALLWFRRDLRLSDHPALLAAAADGEVLPFVVVEPQLLTDHRPPARRLLRSIAALHEATGGALVVRCGHPVDLVPRAAAAVGAVRVHITRDTTPTGRERDEDVAARLQEQGAQLVPTGTPYAIGPGLVRTGAGTPYKVFTPFARAWRDHGWPAPAGRVGEDAWRRHGADLLTGVGEDALARVLAAANEATADGPAGEIAAQDRWRAFLHEDLEGYDAGRDRPDLDVTSRMSIPLAHGEIHPRTMLADLAAHPEAHGDAAHRFVTELAWREFYADVLWHRPDSAWTDLRDALAGLPYDEGPETDRLVEAWRRGRTGFPFVDAGMRQLAAEGFMHNRVRMVVASFLTKDLHVWWPLGARHFLDHLVDGDLASNSHGWQWVAGTGTDPSPYFRVFNPVAQGVRFDPDGAYVRRWVPELAHLPGRSAHQPWEHPDGHAHGYPERIVEHAQERREALDRYTMARART
ncbi:cryptochrome/photolyase family protein [Janibacter sp. G1551]|uniref:cryptochrome/photolyase family protein n=1 Tax=Janibacter sp. G1551 TaxID=3420440 RepID=UPI003CFDC7B5